MFQPDTNKFPDGDKWWELTHIARLQQSTFFFVKASASQDCDNPRTYGPVKKNLQSTKHVKWELEVEEDSNFYPDEETVKTHELYATIIPLNINRKVSIDLTAAFPHKSSRGNFYVMVMYDYDSNTILYEPIKNRQVGTIRNAFLKVHKFLKARCSKLKVYIMDNECSNELK